MSDKVRHRMEQSLLRNLTLQLERKELGIKHYNIEFGRILVDMGNLDSNARDQVLQVFYHVPGLISVSPALRCEKDINKVAEMVGLYTNKFLKPNQSFGIKIKGNTAPLRPQDYTVACNRLIGTPNHPINLHAPDLRIYVEVRDKDVYCYSLILPTPWAGLPIEHEQAIVTQFLGEPNDLVACIRLIRRGCVIFPVLYHSTAQIEGENVIRGRYFDSTLESLTEYYPFDRIYGLKLDLDLIHKRLQTHLNRIWSEIRLQISPDSQDTENFYQEYIFCMLCRRLRYLILQYLIDYQKQIQENLFLQEEKYIIGSNLLFPLNRIDQKSLQEIWLSSSRKETETRKRIKHFKKYMISFNAIVSGENPMMSCPFSRPWLQTIDEIHYPVFYGAIALDRAIILHDLNLITPNIKWNEIDTQSMKPIAICNHNPKNRDFFTISSSNIENTILNAWNIVKEKVNLIKMIPSIVEEAEIVVWTPQSKKRKAK